MLPGIVDVPVIGSKCTRESLGVDVMTSLTDSIARKSRSQNISPDEMTEMAVASKEEQITQIRVSQLRPVAVTLERMRAVGDRVALLELLDEINDESLACGCFRGFQEA